MRKFLFILALLFTLPAWGQSTLVSGTITDQAGQTWNGGNIQFVFYPAPTNPSGPYNWSGGAFNPSQPIPATGKIGLNASGSFSGVSVPDNNTIFPTGSQWSVTVCPAATATCYSTTMTITGPTLNLSSLVIPPAISVNASNFVFLAAYQDSEIVNAPLGASYFNLTDNKIHACSGPTLPCTWIAIGGGGVVTVRHSCDIAVGDESLSPVTNAQLGPQLRMCIVPTASTVIEVDVGADGGTPNNIMARNRAGTEANLVSSALSTAASGGIACSNVGGTTGIDGLTTCSATLQNTALSAGDYIDLVSGTAGGTAKLMTIHVVYTTP